MHDSNSSLSSWLDSKLSEALGFPSTQEITEYILSMEKPSDQERYLSEMLDPSNSQHAELVKEFGKKIRPSQGSVGVGSGLKVYRKADENLEYVAGQKGKKKEKAPPTEAKKGKTKFVNLYSQDGQAKDSIMLNGRHTCECQSFKHDLIGNCISCGRIVCAQEGSGPCLFCGTLVCTKAEREILDRNSKKSELLHKKLMGDESEQASIQTIQGMKKAEQHKNILLEFQKNSEKRTKVIDDESDYFSVDSNKWLTKEQREALKKREDELRKEKHGSRLDRKVTLDFAGRRVVEDTSGLSNYDPSQDETVKQIMALKIGDGSGSGGPFQDALRKTITDGDGVVNPNIKGPRPVLVDSSSSPSWPKSGQSNSSSGAKNNPASSKSRLQDKNLQEMSDEGLCLTMHQPYASLLVAGIKIHEGRTWYSAHRGRLWIHAASRVPTEEEIKQLETFYRTILGTDNLPFPASYPTSCLLGSVDVSDVMSQEDYRETYPQGESSSPYVFICQNPQELLIKYPMSGQHKIYKLDSNIHAASKKSAKKQPAAI